MSEAETTDDDFEEYSDERDATVSALVREPMDVIMMGGGSYSFDPLSQSISSGSVGDIDVNVRTSRQRTEDVVDIVVRFGGSDDPDVHFNSNDLVRAAIRILAGEEGYEQFDELADV